MEPWCKTPAASLLQAGLLLLVLGPAGCLGAGEAPGALSTAAPPDPGAPCASRAACPSGGPRLPRQVSPTATAPQSQVPPTTNAPQVPPTTKAPQMPPTTNAPQVPPTTHAPKVPGATTHAPKVPGATTHAPKVPGATKAPPGTTVFPLTCGMSHEVDPTLRDPEASARRWPWVVSVQVNGTHVCAGSVIASQWVLTVAHCLMHHNATYSVRAGSPWMDRTAQTTAEVPVHQVILNSRFRARRLWSWVGQANNIALLHLKDPLNYSRYIWPICLPGLDYSVSDLSICTVTGWGLPQTNGMWPQSLTIQEKEVTVLNSKQCEDFYHKFSKVPSLIRVINSQMICAEDSNRENFCYEITGEPLVCPVQNTWFLVGMVVWGPGCERSEAPPIYLRISAYQHWIWERINGQALPSPSRALLLALPLPLSLLAAR